MTVRVFDGRTSANKAFGNRLDTNADEPLRYERRRRLRALSVRRLVYLWRESVADLEPFVRSHGVENKSWYRLFRLATAAGKFVAENTQSGKARCLCYPCSLVLLNKQTYVIARLRRTGVQSRITRG